MCYSALIEAQADQLTRELDARFDMLHMTGLLVRSDLPVEVPRLVLESLPDSDAAGKQCRQLIAERQEKRTAVLDAKLKELTGKLGVLSDEQSDHWTKTREKQLLITERAIAKTKADKLRLASPADVVEDARIFPFTYAPICLVEGGKRVIRCFRYQVRPRWADQEVDRKINLYNARLDGLTSKKTWAPLYRHQHAVLVCKGFYEWVQDAATGKSVTLRFVPDDKSSMLVPCLYERWRGKSGEVIESFAMITTEPPPEVLAAGHDRCPVVIRPEDLNDWLNPQSCAPEHIGRILGAPHPVHFVAERA